MGLTKSLAISELDKVNIKNFYLNFLNVKNQVYDEVTIFMNSQDNLKSIIKSGKFIISEVGVTEGQEKALKNDNWSDFFLSKTKLGEKFAILGLSLQSCIELTYELKNSFFKKINTNYFKSNGELLDVVDGMNKFFDYSVLKISEGYIKDRQNIILDQQKVIHELSHPILQIREKLIVLPLIGILDSTRAKQMTKDLLYAIKDKQAGVVILDITGVPIVDTKVANHLIQTAKAVKLMGGTIKMTGISPEIAQTMVTVGAELTGIETLLDLESGILHANKILGYKILKDDQEL